MYSTGTVLPNAIIIIILHYILEGVFVLRRTSVASHSELAQRPGVMKKIGSVAKLPPFKRKYAKLLTETLLLVDAFSG